jgi:hypothetical protein
LRWCPHNTPSRLWVPKVNRYFTKHHSIVLNSVYYLRSNPSFTSYVTLGKWSTSLSLSFSNCKVEIIVPN